METDTHTLFVVMTGSIADLMRLQGQLVDLAGDNSVGLQKLELRPVQKG